MKWGLGMVGGACSALVLGLAVVAPGSSRGAGPVPQPSDSLLSATTPEMGVRSGRALVEVTVGMPRPGEAQSLPRTDDTDSLDSTTVRETSEAPD